MSFRLSNILYMKIIALFHITFLLFERNKRLSESDLEWTHYKLFKLTSKRNVQYVYNSPLLSRLDRSMPSMAVLADPTSVKRSQTAVFCLSRGTTRGDSRMGSMGSMAVIRWIRTHSLGSSTSRTLNWLGLAVGSGSWWQYYKYVVLQSTTSHSIFMANKIAHFCVMFFCMCICNTHTKYMCIFIIIIKLHYY